MTNIEEVTAVWKEFTDGIEDWHTLVEGIEPKQTECGPVYEVPSPLGREGESFAIADMTGVHVAEPHYHTNGETEIYIVLSGLGLTVRGGEEIPIQEGSVVVTPPDTTHFTLPEDNLVLAVVNTPPFDFANNVPITESDPSVGFDREQYDRLTA